MRFLPYVALRLECAISNAAYDRDIRLGPTFERPLSPPTHPKPDLPQSALVSHCHAQSLDEWRDVEKPMKPRKIHPIATDASDGR